MPHRPGRWPSATLSKSPSSSGRSRPRKDRRAAIFPGATVIGASGTPPPTSLLLYLSSRDAIGKLMEAGQGFDVPPFEKLNDFGIWAAAEPPKGTLYNFPHQRGSACRCIRKASGAR